MRVHPGVLAIVSPLAASVFPGVLAVPVRNEPFAEVGSYQSLPSIPENSILGTSADSSPFCSQLDLASLASPTSLVPTQTGAEEIQRLAGRQGFVAEVTDALMALDRAFPYGKRFASSHPIAVSESCHIVNLESFYKRAKEQGNILVMHQVASLISNWNLGFASLRNRGKDYSTWNRWLRDDTQARPHEYSAILQLQSKWSATEASLLHYSQALLDSVGNILNPPALRDELMAEFIEINALLTLHSSTLQFLPMEVLDLFVADYTRRMKDLAIFSGIPL